MAEFDYAAHCAFEKELTEKIRDQGAGAGKKWMDIATAAMQNNEKAWKLCKELMGRPFKNMNDYMAIQSAAYECMEQGERIESYNEAERALNAMAMSDGPAPASLGVNIDGYIANRLSEMRKTKGLTQKELATKAGIPLIMYQRYENGTKSFVRANTIYTTRIARALGVTVEQLIGNVV